MTSHTEIDIRIALCDAREFYRKHGHDVSSLVIMQSQGEGTIGPDNANVRICDIGGCYDYLITSRGLRRVSRGDISRTLESVALRASAVLGCAA